MASLYQRFTGKINTGSSFPVPPEASRLLGQGEQPAEIQRPGLMHPYSQRCEDEDVRRFFLLTQTIDNVSGRRQTSHFSQVVKLLRRCISYLTRLSLNLASVSSKHLGFCYCCYYRLCSLPLGALAARRSARVRSEAPSERSEFSEATSLAAVLKRSAGRGAETWRWPRCWNTRRWPRC